MWKYLPVLNACITVLLTIGVGGLTGYLGIFKAKDFVPQAVKYVFYIAIPSLVARGIGIYVDFYSDKFIWEYISAFLILRAIALVFSFLSVYVNKDAGIGDVAVRWISLSWISTVILGT